MFWTAVIVAIFLLVLWNFVRDEENILDTLPGPPKRPIIGNLDAFFLLKQTEMFAKSRQLVNKYNDRFLLKILKRRILHIYNPQDIEAVLSHSRNISKNETYKFLQPWLGTGLLVSTGSKWHSRRKILTPTFHFNILKNFATIIEEKSLDLVTRLKEKQEFELDLLPVISDFTLNTICETAMGTQLDQDRSTAAVEYKQAILEIGKLVLHRLTRIWLHSDLMFKFSPIGNLFTKTLTKVHSFADNVILERKMQRKVTNKDVVAELEDVLGSKKRMAMLDLLLEAESKGEIDLEGIREEVNTFMFGGHDTTSAAIVFGLMLLADHEDIQERVYEECQRVLESTGIKSSMAYFAELKYTEAVIKETLRLYPSAPFIGREITEDFMMGETYIPKGTEIAILIYDLHRREDLYPEPELFKPERFLGEEKRHPYAFIPFSAGPRNCIGQRFAMQEMKCIISDICRNFKLVSRVKGWRPTLKTDLVLRSADPIYVKFIRR